MQSPASSLSLSLTFQAGAVVLFIHWRVAAERRGRAGDLFFMARAALAELGVELRRCRLATAW
jgi:hypothetical protein